MGMDAPAKPADAKHAANVSDDRETG